MLERNDIDLLRDYVKYGSEQAFATIVSRRIHLVHSVALRHVAQPHHAEEITQAVFIILARKAHTLRPGTILSGWLYQTARLTAANFRRSEIQRARREQEVQMESQINSDDNDTREAWQQVSPLLEDAMADLGSTDRNAILLRYFEQKNLNEIGVSLGMTEEAAKKRVHRAVEKLRKYFGRRNVVLSASVVAGAISAHSIQAAPAGLTSIVTATAAAKGATSAVSTLVLIKSTLKIMALHQIKIIAGAAVGAVILGGTGSLLLKRAHAAGPAPAAESAVAVDETVGAPPLAVVSTSASSSWTPGAGAETLPDGVIIRPAQPQDSTGGGTTSVSMSGSRGGGGGFGGGMRGQSFSVSGAAGGGGGFGGGGMTAGGARGGRGFGPMAGFGGVGGQMGQGTFSARNVPISVAFSYGYGVPISNVVLPESAPSGYFDVLVGLKEGGPDAVKQELQKQFNLTAHTEVRPTDVLILQAAGNGITLTPNQSDRSSMSGRSGSISVRSGPTGTILNFIERQFGKPVLDRTGMQDRYDFDLSWSVEGSRNEQNDSIRQSLNTQLGLTLVESREPIEKLIVEKESK